MKSFYSFTVDFLEHFQYKDNYEDETNEIYADTKTFEEWQICRIFETFLTAYENYIVEKYYPKIHITENNCGEDILKWQFNTILDEITEQGSIKNEKYRI